MKFLRYLGAVLAAGAASWLCPFIIAAFIFVTDKKIDNLGRIDNAPYRAAGGFLLLTPLFVVMFGLWIFTTSAVLRLVNRYSLQSLIITSVIMALCTGTYLSRQDISVDDPRNAAIAFGMFTGTCLICLLFGSVAWWYSSPQIPDNEALKGEVPDGAPLS